MLRLPPTILFQTWISNKYWFLTILVAKLIGLTPSHCTQRNQSTHRTECLSNISDSIYTGGITNFSSFTYSRKCETIMRIGSLCGSNYLKNWLFTEMNEYCWKMIRWDWWCDAGAMNLAVAGICCVIIRQWDILLYLSADQAVGYAPLCVISLALVLEC